MQITKNIVVEGSAGRPMGVDVFVPQDQGRKPVVIYAHGFNGFKDWGNFDLIAKQFAEAGLVFIKFNFSHNGTPPEHAEEFVDLEAYGNNNYTKELNDLQAIIDWTLSPNNQYSTEIDPDRFYLLGHSRGGGIVILKASEDARVKKVATWASVSECKTPWGLWPAERIRQWEKSGVDYIANSRTKQQLPLYFQMYQDYQANEQRLNIQAAISSLKIPILLCHGTNDEAVPISKAHDLQAWQPAAELFVVESDHGFGRKHPWQSDQLPQPMHNVTLRTIQFFKSI